MWDQRLQYLAELPKGKTVGMFQTQRHLQGQGSRRRHHVHHRRHAELAAAERHASSRSASTRKQLCEVVGKGGGFIMTTDVGEMEGCKPELVRAWMDATREFGVY